MTFGGLSSLCGSYVDYTFSGTPRVSLNVSVVNVLRLPLIKSNIHTK